MTNSADKIRRYILQKVPKHPHDIVQLTANHFNVSRTTVHRHISTLVRRGELIKSGTTNNIAYCLAGSLSQTHRYKMSPQLNESDIYHHDFEALFSQFHANIKDICHFGFSEMFNNAIDHAKANHIVASTEYNGQKFTIVIQDDGIGIFEKIAAFLNLDDIKESVLHLSKGKLTTDPANHTGEGIFFSSRVFDTFELIANGLHYYRDNYENDWGLQHDNKLDSGTQVRMSININSEAQLIDIFKAYQDPGSLEFARTEIIVELSRLGEETLISRSQAKRVLQGLDKFQYITLDFKDVRLIGQGFVDEIFRVYQNSYPNKVIQYQNANSDVTFMIKRGIG